MQSTTSKTRQGFTLVELLIVIAILGVLAAVVVPSVIGMFGRGEQEQVIRERAQYVVYVEEGGVPKLIGTIDLGEVKIQLPKKMSVGDSGEVQLSLIPLEESSGKVLTIYSPTCTDCNVVSDVVQLYSVMSAELKAVNFAISDQKPSRVVSPLSQTEWRWIISPRIAGEQLLIAELSTPVHVQGFENEVPKAVYSRSFSIPVKETKPPFDWGHFWTIFGSVTGGIGSLIVGIVALKALKRKRRRRSTKQTKVTADR